MSEAQEIVIPLHRLKVALLQPQIAPNTGNVARLCVASGTELHLVRPLGFILSDQKLKRSAMDYWEKVTLTIHDDTGTFFEAMGNDRFWLFTTKAQCSYWDADFHDGDWLIFGSETGGISEILLEQHRQRRVRIPQVRGERCLNLSTAAGIGLYEAIRQCRRRA
jgi:tRNA (cytidine/uridine-2'-O-)-methyltransferase